MIEFTENAASTRYGIFVNQNCSDHSGAMQRTRAKRCLLAAGPLTRLTGFVQHELYRRPAPILAHFLVLLEIFRDRIRALGWRWPSIRTLVRPVDIIDAPFGERTHIRSAYWHPLNRPRGIISLRGGARVFHSVRDLPLFFSERDSGQATRACGALAPCRRRTIAPAFMARTDMGMSPCPVRNTISHLISLAVPSSDRSSCGPQ